MLVYPVLTAAAYTHQTSDSFFEASQSLIRVTLALDATCNVNFERCNSLMASLAQQLVSDDNCGVDYQSQSPVVLQAYNGFIAYEPLYRAGCLRDDLGNFCELDCGPTQAGNGTNADPSGFANAVTNSTSVTDSYPYYLPLGVDLPGGGRPTCNSCLQDAMAIFANAATNATQPVSRTYPSAARQIEIGCGPRFVDSSVSVPTSGSSVLHTTTGFGPLIALMLALFALF